MADDTLGTDLRNSLETQADKPMLTVLGRRNTATHFTGQQLLEKAEQALTMWNTCLGPGPHVLIVALPAGEGFLVSLIASLLGGGTIVPVAPPRPSDPQGRLLRMAQTCGATAVLCTHRNQTAVETQLRDRDGQIACPVLAIDHPKPTAMHDHIPRACPYPVIQHTSGSTRFPKAVGISAAQIRENCGMIQSLWGMNCETVMVNWLPHYHDMGLMGCIVYPLLSGARSVQMSPFDMIRRPLSWLEAISSYKGTISGGPTFAFLECMNRIAPEDSADLDLGSWGRAFCGAEPVPAGLLDRFSARFAANKLARDAVFSCYGMAECTLFAAGEVGPAAQDTDMPAPFQATEGCLLSPQTRANIRILDPKTGAHCPDRMQGEIWLAGGSLSDGYLSDPEATAARFRTDADGRRWMGTGDLGGIAGHYLYITGRIKDVINVNGRDVSAAEVEWVAARAHPALNPSCAAAFAHDGAGSGQAHLCIEIRANAQPPENPAAVVKKIRKSVAGSCGVALGTVRILPRGALPRTSSGKVKRQQVAQEFIPFAPPTGAAREVAV